MPNRVVHPDERARRIEEQRRLFDFLRDRGIKRAWLAQRLGISHGRLYNYERGLNRPPEWFLPRSAEALGIPVSLLRPNGVRSHSSGVA